MTLVAEQQRARDMFRVLRTLFPHAGMMLRYQTNWELLVAVMLSAQCTDKKVNEVTERLFKKYPTLDAYVQADPREFERDIFQTGFYRAKTRHVLAAAHVLAEQYHGELPKTIEELTQFPGVGRKTANVVLGNAFGIVDGIAVDTHVKRFARVYGLSRHADPKHIEQDLMRLLPQPEWFTATYLMIEYGRKYCPARKHDHAACPLFAFSTKRVTKWRKQCIIRKIYEYPSQISHCSNERRVRNGCCGAAISGICCCHKTSGAGIACQKNFSQEGGR